MSSQWPQPCSQADALSSTQVSQLRLTTFWLLRNTLAAGEMWLLNHTWKTSLNNNGFTTKTRNRFITQLTQIFTSKIIMDSLEHTHGTLLTTNHGSSMDLKKSSSSSHQTKMTIPHTHWLLSTATTWKQPHTTRPWTTRNGTLNTAGRTSEHKQQK